MRFQLFWKFFTFIVLVTVLSVQPTSAQTAEPTPDSPPLTLVWQTATTPEALIIGAADIAVDMQGNVYINMTGEKHVKKYDKDGNFVTQWGSTGSGEGQFSLTGAIAVDKASKDSNVYVSDFSTMRIEKFDSNGKFLLQWSTEPPAGPGGLAVDKDGNVYNDNFALHDHYMQKFDSNGKLLKRWGTTGKGDGQFAAMETGGPEDIAIDKDDNIYVADRLNQRIQKFDKDGNFLAKFGGNGESFLPTGVAVDTEGNIYAYDGLNYYLRKLDKNGKTLAQWSVRGTELDGMVFLVVDWQGYLYTYAHPRTKTGGLDSNFVVKKFRQP